MLLLLSASFISSDFCYSDQLEEAIKCHDDGTAVVIPIILRACDWKMTPVGVLRPLPDNARPIAEWPNRDKAYHNVAEGVRRVLKQTATARTSHKPRAGSPSKPTAAFSPVPNPYEVIEHVTSLWDRALGRPQSHLEAIRRFYGLSIGTLTAAKLYLRIMSGGELKFTGKLAVLQQWDRYSNQIADDIFSADESDRSSSRFYRVLRGAKRTYLSSVRDRTDYRWCKDTIAADDAVPVPFEHLGPCKPLADDVMHQIMEYVTLQRQAVLDDYEQHKLTMVCHIISLMALSKMMLASHGNAKVAAFVESLAEMASAAEYQQQLKLRADDEGGGEP